MPVLKFSGITQAGANLTSSDFLMAVQGGTTDILFTPAQVFAFANLVFASDILEQRRTTNPNTFRVYNTFTDASNYERAVFDWTTTANTLTIGTEKAGTGTLRGIIFVCDRIDMSPASNGIICNNGGGYAFGSNSSSFLRGDAAGFAVAGGAVNLANSQAIGWSSTANWYDTIDLTLKRGAAGILQFGNSGSFSANATTATILGSVGPSGANTTVQKWLTIKDDGGNTLYIPCF